MREKYITEDPRMYLPRIGTFVFVTLVALAVWHFLKIRGSEIFVVVGAIGLVYSIYSYFAPKKILCLSARGVKMMESQVTVPWERISEVEVCPFEEGEYVRPGMRHIVCLGYSPRAEGLIEWWRIGTTVRVARRDAQKILQAREYFMKESSK